MKILVLTHSHPRLTRGGAEISADALARGLRAAGATAWLLGCSQARHAHQIASGFTQPFGEGDFVYQVQGPFETFNFANRDAAFPRMLEDLLAELRPDIVHFQHYHQFGVEAFATVRRVLPRARIVLTLHEYLAICHNNGQMVKTRTAQLCEEATHLDCSACFPVHGPKDFFLRKTYLMHFLDKVDLFIAPSRFLAQRYTAWGLSPDTMAVLDNVPPFATSGPAAEEQAPLPAALASADGRRRADGVIRIGFFGQMSPLKGITVLLDAARELLRKAVESIVIDIHGDYSNQPPAFQEAVKEGLAESLANVTYHGPYDNRQVLRLMGTVDAVCVPSIWWENAPVVIEEALAAGKPVLCSNIGGMAEKVRDGLDGFWFEKGDRRSLAHLLATIAADPALLHGLAGTMRKPATVEDAVDAHLAAYHALLQGP